MSAQRRSTGRSPVMQRGGAAAAASRARGGVLGGSSGGSTHHGSGDWLWVKRVAAASLALIGCFLVVMFVAPGTPSSSLSSSSSKAGAAAALMSRLRGNNKMEGSQEDHHQQQQQLALLNAYCEAPLGAQSLEGAAHLPLPPQSRAKLRQLQVVIRHGDRSPISSLTTPPPLFSCKLRDPAMVRLAQLMKAEGKDAPFRIVGMGGTATRAYLATNLLPEGKEAGEEEQACFPGQLTERGFRQQVANGRFLRERYAEALGPITDPSTELYMRSTNYPRTFQSGAALLLSFLGQADDAGDAATTSITNITVHVQEENRLEPLFGLGLVGASRARSVDPFEAPDNERGPCALAFQLGARQEAAFAPDAALDAQFGSELGLSGEGKEGGPSDLSVADQADPLMGMHCHSKALPVALATAARLKAETDRLYCERFTGQDGGKEGTRLGMQPFLAEAVAHFTQAAAGGGPKLALYAAHDTVIAPLVAALDGYDGDDGCRGRWPPYASRVVMELWEVPMDGGGSEEQQRPQFVIRLLFNGRVISDRSKHCPGFKHAKQAELHPTLLPFKCLEQYVDRLDDQAGESCLDAST